MVYYNYGYTWHRHPSPPRHQPLPSSTTLRHTLPTQPFRRGRMSLVKLYHYADHTSSVNCAEGGLYDIDANIHIQVFISPISIYVGYILLANCLSMYMCQMLVIGELLWDRVPLSCRLPSLWFSRSKRVIDQAPYSIWVYTTLPSTLIQAQIQGGGYDVVYTSYNCHKY